jgi:3-oxoacyl-[acyl-carrier protein] reductase
VCAITSIGVKQPIGFLLASSVARAGLTSFLKITAREVAADGVTVNDIATGRFATDRLAANWGGREEMERGAPADVPAGRLGTPAEYGDLVAFLASERAAYITGTAINMDGGVSAVL